MMLLDLEEEEDIPLAKFAKLANGTHNHINHNHNPMITNMENILKEFQHDPFSAKLQKQVSIDEVSNSNLELSILIEEEKQNYQPVVNGHHTEPIKITPEIPSEYEWPERSGEFYLLVNSLAKFLEVPPEDDTLTNLDKREISDNEKDHLVEISFLDSNNVSGEIIKVARTEEAFQFLCENNQPKFQIYIEGVHKREMKNLIQKQEAQRKDVITGNVSRILKRTLKETVKYNSKLNSERKESRCAYFDLQTQIIHLPQKKRVYEPNRKSNCSSYPIALLPGQYQDFYKIYTPEELKMFPLNTVTSFPCPKSIPVAAPPPPPPPPQPIEKEKSVEPSRIVSEPVSIPNAKKNEVENALLKDIEPNKDPFCGICMKGPEMNKRGLAEKLIHCSQCENSGHPSCLDMNRHLVMVIKTYPWQCMECKVCTECLAPHDEEEMIFCDNCDRGYHSYCVGLKEIPKGRWVCTRCGKCASCLDMNPVPEGTPGRWKNEHSKPCEGEASEFLQVHCHSCSKLFRKGAFCPVCLKVYRTDEDHINPMVCCDICDRWIHTDCDGIDDHRYQELSKDSKSSYTCILCRGEKDERMDSFHKKFRSSHS